MQESATSTNAPKNIDPETADSITCPACRHEFRPAGRRSVAEQGRSPATTSMSVDHDAPSLTEKAQRRGSPLAKAVRWLGLSAVLIGVTVALLLFVLSAKNRDAREVGSSDTDDTTFRWPSVAADSTGETSPAIADRSNRVVQAVEHSIVLIETSGPAGTVSLGSGFVVDDRGMVATNYHVLSEATIGRVRFQNGTTYEIEGYVAVRPEDDLAVVKLRDPPSNLRPLGLAFDSDPERQSEVTAVGHPDGVDFSLFNGKVSQVLRTSRLSGRSRAFLEQHLRSEQDHRWVQHTAALTEGNSGGPLLDERGDVVGVNTWVDKQTGFNYALHAMYLNRLLQSPWTAPAPLEKFATQEARFAAAMQRLSIERVERLFQEAKTMQWAPRSRIEYQTLQQLALAITQTRVWASSGGSKTIRDELLEPLINAVDAIEAEIELQANRIVQQLTLLNEFASHELFDASEGLIFVATVESQFDGDDGQRGMLVILSGYEQKVFVPLTNIFLNPEPGTHYLIIGLNQNGQVVRFGANPLQLESAPVIVSRTVLPLGK